MTKKEIINYIMETPQNTNPAILSDMLDSFEVGDNKEEIELLVTENGVYAPDEGKVYKKVTVEVESQPETVHVIQFDEEAGFHTSTETIGEIIENNETLPQIIYLSLDVDCEYRGILKANMIYKLVFIEDDGSGVYNLHFNAIDFVPDGFSYTVAVFGGADDFIVLEPPK